MLRKILPFLFMLSALLRCVCGAVVEGLDDLRVADEANGLIRLRCGNGYCELEEVCTVSVSGENADVRFSRMFSEYNLLFMGRDELTKKLRRLGVKVVKDLFGGKSIKTRIKIL
ncbi:MAG: hypothetical protein QXN23_06365 [Candidatus Caldarchaeum sp.]|uniref:Uncharacterized protein n=1 Tax=Caldiarchaeum subterraneum TaxID=311458 RepID=A0A7C4E2G6_CALS0|nr:hypothetical protein [Candidatus Caldarchaeales archaeon]